MHTAMPHLKGFCTSYVLNLLITNAHHQLPKNKSFLCQ